MFGVRPSASPAAKREPLDVRLQDAISAAPVGIARITLSGRWISLNDACFSILGYTQSELTRLTLHDITHRDDAERELVLMREMLEGRARSYRISKRVVDKRGGHRVIHVTAIVLRGDDEQSHGFLYVIEAADWRAEIDPLSHRVGADVLDQLSCTGIIWTDDAGMITGWNAGAERLFGYRRAEILGKHRSELYRAQEREGGAPAEEIAIAETRGRYEDTGWRQRKDGSEVRVHGLLLRLTPDGATRGYVEEVTTATESLYRQKADAYLQDLRLQIRNQYAKKLAELDDAKVEFRRELSVLANALREEIDRRKAAEAEVELLHAERVTAPTPILVLDEVAVELTVDARDRGEGTTLLDETATTWFPGDGRAAIDLIQETAQRNRSGVLILKSEQRRADLFFEYGRIAATMSDDPGSRLGEWMVSRGLITDDARQQALEMSDFGEIAFGRSLLTLKVMTEEAIVSAVREKIESDVERCAEMPIVRWAFAHSATTRTLVPIGVDPRELRALRIRIAPPAAVTEVIALPDGKRYHRSSCTSIIRASATARSSLSRLAAEARGLSACRRCAPDHDLELAKPVVFIAR
jgi:PAS domain S-box-containing protein